jgi:hypothetical protein
MTAKVARGGAQMDKPRWVRILAITVEAHGVTGALRRRGPPRHETDEAPVQNEKARRLSPPLTPISRHLPICRQSDFGTASSLQQTPTLAKA